jgi:hypothetical protein
MSIIHEYLNGTLRNYLEEFKQPLITNRDYILNMIVVFIVGLVAGLLFGKSQ